MYVCVCAHVCVKERERERKRERALKVVLLPDWYPELIFTSITSLSIQSWISMKGLLQTIDLGNDEEERISQT